MRKLWTTLLLMAVMLLLVIPLPGAAKEAGKRSGMELAKEKNGIKVMAVKEEKKGEAAEEEIPEIDPDGVSGEVSITGRAVRGLRESAKFTEYRDFPAVSSFLGLRYKKEDLYFDVRAKNIGGDDLRVDLQNGLWGTYKLKLVYDQIPHRFAFDGRSLYSGIGTGNLTLPDSMQTFLQASGTLNNLWTRINNIFTGGAVDLGFPGAGLVDIDLLRKRSRLEFDLVQFDPVNFKAELRHEKREGTRPYGASFGFANTIEVPEPINYDIVDGKLSAEYLGDNFYLNGSYHFSVFQNNIDALVWDNPYRITDSSVAASYNQSFQSGPSRGRIDLYPNNRYSNFSVTGSVFSLPGKSKLAATASWGRMRQDDLLFPYTTNTAITTGVVGAPFNASDPRNLPADRVDGRVDLSMLNVLFTSNPYKGLYVKARYHTYDFNNRTAEITFPGYVRMDAVWVAPAAREVIESEPVGFKKRNAEVDVAYEVLPSTRVSVNYGIEDTTREHREGIRSSNNSLKLSVDSNPFDWLDVRASHEISSLSGDYLYFIPFGNRVNPPQLPFMRKFDMANKDRTRTQLLLTVMPGDSLTFSGSFITGEDDFKDSFFGLLNDRHTIWSLDSDWSATDSLDLFAFYVNERYRTHQRARQWGGSGVENPYFFPTTLVTNSNWEAENTDYLSSIGVGMNYNIIPEKLDLNGNYSISTNDGLINFASPLGTAANDRNAFTPIPFHQVDDTRLQTLELKVSYNVDKNLSVKVGYYWQKFTIRDFNFNGFDFIPATPTGAYNGSLFMGGALPVPYDASFLYGTFTCAF